MPRAAGRLPEALPFVLGTVAWELATPPPASGRKPAHRSLSPGLQPGGMPGQTGSVTGRAQQFRGEIGRKGRWLQILGCRAEEPTPVGTAVSCWSPLHEEKGP